MAQIITIVLILCSCQVLAQPQCKACQDYVSTADCPQPGFCGFKPVPGQPWCYQCVNELRAPKCPQPGACGFKAVHPGPFNCTRCVPKTATIGCPHPGRCGFEPPEGEPWCTDCMDAMSMTECPRPGLCGYQPVPPDRWCYQCMNGMGMQDCPDPAQCGFKPIILCDGCMKGMSMPGCPDPAACGFGSPDDCQMRAWFNVDSNVCVWLAAWHVTNGAQWFGTILAIMLFSMGREFFAAFRTHRTGKKAKGDDGTLLESDSSSSSPSRSKIDVREMLLDSLFYLGNVTLAYLLMLIFMTYNIGLCLTMLFGLFLGHFLSAYFYKRKAAAEADHCCSE